ncbi:MAG TPA: ribonuclease P protein component 3 [Candidatus Methanoperedenaceae archaeon]|nr:ribonuclease P protein component 3 [Candidatus Methanoperedenaceae archaeon]
MMFASRFIDIHVHAMPQCADSQNRMSLAAARMGYTGICVANLPEFITGAASGTSGIGAEVRLGVELCPDKPSRLEKDIAKYGQQFDVIIVRGGSEELNEAALKSSRVDILENPLEFNHVLAKLARDNHIALGFNIGGLLLRGSQRIQALSMHRKNLMLARKYGVPVVLASGARSHYDLRAPREMAALAMLFGMTLEESVRALSTTPLDILNKGRLMQGLEVVV